MKTRPSPIGDGVLLIDKPEGISSAAAVATVKRTLGGAKVGHLGTLDPFASGLLPMCIGEATKAAPYLNVSDKRYLGVVRLGVESDTLDTTGTLRPGSEVPRLDEPSLENLSERFRGEIEQVPPAFSAIKKNGVPMYKLARSGREVTLNPRPVVVHDLRLRVIDDEHIGLDVTCSKGTYVRSLARDIGGELGCGGCLERLRRTAFGPFRLEDAAPLDALPDALADGSLQKAVIVLDRALGGMPAFEIDRATAAELRLGRQTALRRLPSPASADPGVRAKVLAEGDLVAVLAPTRVGWKLERIFAPPVR